MQIKRNNEMQYPEMGDNTNLFQRLANYISIFDYDWIERIIPASRASIDLLMKVAEVNKWEKKIPESYLIFLKYMGANDGGLLSKSLVGTAEIDEIIDLYEEFHKYSPEVFCEPYFPFFQREMGGELSFDLSGKHTQNIVETDNGEYFRVAAENFENLLFQCAFDRFVRYNNFISFSGSPNRFNKAISNHETEDIYEMLDDIAKNYGLQKAWFSDSKHYIAIGISDSFCVKKMNGVLGFATGNNKRIIEEISMVLSGNLGADIQRKELE